LLPLGAFSGLLAGRFCSLLPGKPVASGPSKLCALLELTSSYEQAVPVGKSSVHFPGAFPPGFAKAKSEKDAASKKGSSVQTNGGHFEGPAPFNWPCFGVAQLPDQRSVFPHSEAPNKHIMSPLRGWDAGFAAAPYVSRYVQKAKSIGS